MKESRISRHIDITFDFETVSTAPNAAPMMLAAVVWDRFAEGENPFLEGIDSFCEGVDLRSCVVDGFDFDAITLEWWSRQSEQAKNCVTAGVGAPVREVFEDFKKWIEIAMDYYEAETVCLWCQGQDFDFPILKTIARKYGLKMPVHQHYFRDCRTVILETAAMMMMRMTGKVMEAGRPAVETTGVVAGRPAIETAGVVAEEKENERRRLIAGTDGILKDPEKAYLMIPEMPKGIVAGGSHDPVYDCMRSSWNVWQCMKMMRERMRVIV